MQKFYKLINNIKLPIASIFTVFVVLFYWKITYSYHCLALVFPLILLAVIAWSLIEIKIHKRLCFKNCYFKETSILARFLTSKITVIVFYLLVSVVMTASIAYSIVDYPKELWGYIALHIMIVIVIFKFLNKKLASSIHAKYLHLFSREMTINISMLLFIFAYIYIVVNGHEPTYLREALGETMKAATNSIHSQCYIVDYVLRLKTELDAWFWWSVIYTSEVMDNRILKYSMWTAFITINGLAILGINRFIVQIVYLLNIMFNIRKTDEEKLDA
jgi:hypothetical protein